MTHEGQYAYGSYGRIDVANHDLSCPGGLNFFATTHLQNLTGDKAVEVGYDDWKTAFGTEIWQVFYEGYVNYNQNTCGRGSSYWLNPGVFVDFKVTNIPGTNGFNLFADWGGGWVKIASCDNTFSHGWSQSETGRFGGTSTGASEEHKNLQFKTSGGSWAFWGDNFETGCGNPCISNWHYWRCTATRFKIIKNGLPNVC